MKLALHWKILIGLVLGLAAGIIVHLAWAPTEILPGGERVAGTWDRLGVGDVATYFAGKASDANADAGLAAGVAKFAVNANTFAGQLFLRLLKLIAVPIVVFSLIVGASSLNDLKKLSRIGGKTIAIYISTTAIAITIGLVLANVVQPGRYLPDEDRTQLTQRELANATAKIEAAADRDVWRTILDIVPENPFDAIASGRMLQVVCLSLMVGIGLTLIPEVKARPIIVFFDGMTDVVIKLIHIIMLAAPYAVFALMANA
ncbi:MAG: dicarboxylate/amino acid:cation symporter, partial [Phycisphaerales bacterium]|nr:dicarboxylate/amino acid:cation symporter [Phycisphaerales bacterium]